MKKLMIVAAVAAIAGAADALELNDQLYQLTINVKSTVGKSGKVTYNLGKNAAGKFWYTAPSLATWLDNTKPVGEMIKDTDEAKKYFTYKKVKGSNVPVPTDAGLAAAAVNDKLVDLAKPGQYDKKSDNTWCFTFKNDECYRVAGTIKATGWFKDTECLDSGNFILVDAFGGGTAEACKNVEVYANTFEAIFGGSLFTTAAGAASGAGDIVDYGVDNLKTQRGFISLQIAGHGAWGKVYDPLEEKTTDLGVTSVSGNVVGLATQGVCTSCCLPDTPVVTLDCCVPNAGTAVFGTFTIKYNLAQTKKELY